MNPCTKKPRPCTKRRLALRYFPHSRLYRTAVANLRNLMKRNEELMKELHRNGYRDYDRVFTPRQVAIIYRYLGEP